MINDLNNEALCAVPKEAKIWDVVKNLGSMKALGPDGFSTIFFQQFWRITKMEVIGTVRKFFQSGYLLKELKYTHIVRIPKIENPTLVSHYCLISLCNVTYKIISKLLANQLKVVIHKLISKSQSAFVLGQRIQDNIILVNEIMHTFKKKRGRGGLMALKVDTEKAYDKVNWSFLMEIMRCCGFSQFWRHMIFQFISTPLFSILLNGSPFGFFQSQRGLGKETPKLGWQVIKEPKCLWIQAVKAKYLESSSFLEYQDKPDVSWIWKGVERTRELVIHNLYWKVKSGKKTLIWNHPWVPNVRVIYQD